VVYPPKLQVYIRHCTVHLPGYRPLFITMCIPSMPTFFDVGAQRWSCLLRKLLYSSHGKGRSSVILLLVESTLATREMCLRKRQCMITWQAATALEQALYQSYCRTARPLLQIYYFIQNATSSESLLQVGLSDRVDMSASDSTQSHSNTTDTGA
jgi:hypothetical protein